MLCEDPAPQQQEGIPGKRAASSAPGEASWDDGPLQEAQGAVISALPLSCLAAGLAWSKTRE